MTKFSARTRALAAGLIYGLMAGTPLLADDTEIYVGLAATQAGAKPNVLFVIDTSGSMGSSVTISTPTPSYDPSQNYGGSCRDDRIYWSDSGNVPSCGTSRYFERSKFRCAAAATALDVDDTGVGIGFYQDRVARWRDSNRSSRRKWYSLSTSVRSPPHVECRGDSGVHGEDATSGKKYIVNGDKWQASVGGSLNWASTGGFYTLYSGNYVNWSNGVGSGTSTTTRIKLVQEVVNNLIDANNGLRVGLMRFDTNQYNVPGLNLGGAVVYAMSDIDTAGVKTSFKSAVNALNASGNTPLAETMYEALLYYRGQPVHFGKAPNTYKSVAASLDPSDTSKYKSPIEFECSKNFIVYLTDGDPTSDYNADTQANALLGTASGAGLTLGGCGGSDNCLDELAEFGRELDHGTAALGNPLNDDQNIVTYTVGFATDQSLLQSAAIKGGGKYYKATNAQDLGSAFTQIITEIQAVNTTFTAPAVSVNAFNRVTHRKELYFTLFKPALTPHWDGNVKRFELDFLRDGSGDPIDTDGDGQVDPPEVLDAVGLTAVDPNTGFFRSTAQSFWTVAPDLPDGDVTEKGGVAQQLPENPALRKVYTNVNAAAVLSDASNALVETNVLVTDALLGTAVATPAERVNLLKWARGVDVDDADEDGSTTDGRHVMGDPLHAKPTLVTYGGTDANPDITMYAMTNDGYLHAIDITDGKETFAFVPKQLLPKLKTVYENVGGAGITHNYGLDGGIEVWSKDHNGNGQIETPDADGNNDHVYLYFGQRRGGRNYFALDVTDRANPAVLWTIEGGIVDGTFEELGETWSQPQHHRIQVKSGANLVAKDVLVFGGGYDPDQDTASTRTTDDQGRAVYIVDALTGGLLWWASGTDREGASPAVTLPVANLQIAGMDYSIPSDVRVLDTNTDGFADRIYLGDMGGQLLRFDIDNATVDVIANRITGGIVWDLQKTAANGGTPGTIDNRRFYYPPDVAYIPVADGYDYLSLAIGSGHRAHPLDTVVQDRFYVLRDFNIFTPPVAGTPAVVTYTKGDDSTLIDRTSLNPSLTAAQTLAQKDGWYIKLNDVSTGSFVGEKVLSAALTFDGNVLFTTFTPVSSGSASSCSPSQGSAKLYLVNIGDAAPLENFDEIGDDNNLTRADRAYNLVRSGIPPEVTVLFPGLDADAIPVALVGAEKLDLDLSQTAIKTYWFQQ